MTVHDQGSAGRPLRCREVQRLVQSFLDGELPPEQAERVADHLHVCEVCGVDAETLRRVKAAIARLRPDIDLDAKTRLTAYVTSLTR